MIKLTKSQVQELYTFTRAHFVEHYDLQTELVDHLANDIEQMWLKTPKLSFEDAKHRAFKKFGIFGFMEPIEQKAKFMNKRYRKYLWKELKKWFEVPQIILTIGLFLCFFYAFSSIYIDVFSIVFYVLILIWIVYKSIQLNRQFRKRKEISGKKWMLEELIFKQAGGVSLIFLSQMYHIFTVSEKMEGNSYAIIVLSIAFTAFVLISYISFELIPNKAEDLLNETYPEFSL